MGKGLAILQLRSARSLAQPRRKAFNGRTPRDERARLAVGAVVVVMVAEQFHLDPEKQALGGQVDAAAAVKLQRRSASRSCIATMWSRSSFPRPRCCSQYVRAQLRFCRERWRGLPSMAAEGLVGEMHHGQDREVDYGQVSVGCSEVSEGVQAGKYPLAVQAVGLTHGEFHDPISSSAKTRPLGATGGDAFGLLYVCRCSLRKRHARHLFQGWRSGTGRGSAGWLAGSLARRPIFFDCLSQTAMSRRWSGGRNMLCRPVGRAGLGRC